MLKFIGNKRAHGQAVAEKVKSRDAHGARADLFQEFWHCPRCNQRNEATRKTCSICKRPSEQKLSKREASRPYRFKKY